MSLNLLANRLQNSFSGFIRTNQGGVVESTTVSYKNNWDTSTQHCFFTSGPSPYPPNVVYRS